MSQQIESVKMALQELGINASGEFFYNPDYDLLIAHETSPELTGAARGVMTDSGAVAVDTGIFTAVRRAINTSSATNRLATPSGGQTPASAVMTISRYRQTCGAA